MLRFHGALENVPTVFFQLGTKYICYFLFRDQHIVEVGEPKLGQFSTVFFRAFLNYLYSSSSKGFFS